MYPETNPNCGCPDTTVPTVEAPAPPACEGEACAEVINTACVRYDGPILGCIETTTNMSLTALIVAMSDVICSTGGGSTTVTGITWGCVATPGTTSVSDAVQTVVTSLNAQKIAYSTSDFTVTGTSCSDRTLTLKKGVWTNITPVAWYNGFSAATTLQYLLDADGMIHLRGTIARTSPLNMASGSIVYSGGGVGIKVVDLPGYLLPIADRNTTVTSGEYPIQPVPGFNNSQFYGQNTAVNPNYMLMWTLSGSKTVVSSNYYFSIGVYVPYGATQTGTGSVGGTYSTGVSFYLQPVKYTVN